MEVSIKLNGGGLDFSSNVTLFQATQIMAFIAQQGEASEAPIQLVASLPKPELLTNSTNIISRNDAYDSPRAAINELGAKVIAQKIVAIALYLGATSQNAMVLSYEQVLAEFVKAGEPKPGYFARDIRDAVKLGYIYLEGKDSFRILASTDAITTSGFPKLKKKISSTKSKNSKPAEKLSIRPEVTALPITSTLDSYADYLELKKRPDQILWILKYAQVNSLPSLNRLEVIDICSKLNGVLTSKNYMTSNEPNINKGYITTVQSLISLNVNGEKHLKGVKKSS